MEMIKQFDLPIVMTEFFSPVGKKEEITFPEFCSLFKSKNSLKGIFIQPKNMNNNFDYDMKNETINNFPIFVHPKY
jgi:hypothetical protein